MSPPKPKAKRAVATGGDRSELKPVRVTCRACRGTGRVDLVPSLRETLDALREAPMTAGDLRTRALLDSSDPTPPPSANAFNNRLEELREYGFVGRSRDGREWRYHLTRNISAHTGLLGRRCL